MSSLHPASDHAVGDASEWIAITPMRMELLPSYHECLDSVCREGKYLMNSCAPDLEHSREFVTRILEAGEPMVVAVIPGMRVIGWCDIYRLPHSYQFHVGRLGMGISHGFRNQGIGNLLMQRALHAARRARMERIELDVFEHNARAIALYHRWGFEREGFKRCARKIRGSYENMIAMAKLMPHGFDLRPSAATLDSKTSEVSK